MPGGGGCLRKVGAAHSRRIKKGAKWRTTWRLESKIVSFITRRKYFYSRRDELQLSYSHDYIYDRFSGRAIGESRNLPTPNAYAHRPLGR
ncbi:MAG: hypothetical protein A2Y76_02925 [Planctomycetes bacterium RBG_13_60_9]|nr:MAG: hypothetical protein A2Y76_02925 [Planctomycetes bacterium RBG_13_60_9]